MKYTNNLLLPDGLVRAVTNDTYSKDGADFSITELIAPAQQRALSIKHDDEITEDVADRIYSLYGQIVHGIFERAEMEAIPEGKYKITLSGKTIKGGIDRLCLVSGTLQDYKFQTLFRYRDGKLPWDIECQINSYVLLLKRNGVDIKKAEAIAVLRDWSKTRAAREPGYPQLPVMKLNVPIWPEEKTVAYLEGRIREHLAAREAIASGVPAKECDEEERWAKDKVFAVMKNGGKRAVSGGAKHETIEAAKAHAERLGANHYVEERQAESIRCNFYCNVKDFCPQYKKMTGDG